jgi:hypothetical protein
MNRIIFVLLAVPALAPASIAAQTRTVPIRTLTPATGVSISVPNSLIGVGELAGGRVLIRDNTKRVLTVYDSTLSAPANIVDAEGASGTFYPAGRGFASAPIAYRGDTALLVDLNIPGFAVVTPDGKMGSLISHPVANDLSVVIEREGMNGAFDNRGRFIYREKLAPPTGQTLSAKGLRDTIRIVRADLDKRSVDTIAQYGIPVTLGMAYAEDAAGQRLVTQIINPYPLGPDGWAVLSTGTLGVVRAHDYRVDWVRSDGTTATTGKLPFDWKPFTEAEKLARTDSMKRIVDSAFASGRSVYGRAFFARRDASGRVIGRDTVKATIKYATPKEMPDYYSPIRDNSVKADLDGNLWILPTTSASAQGGLLYDLVNEKEGLHERVQLPAGCNVAGFGRKRVVFLSCLKEGKWTVERRAVAR